MTEFKREDRVKVKMNAWTGYRGREGVVDNATTGIVVVDIDGHMIGYVPSELELIQDPRDEALDEIREAWFSLPWEKALDKIDDVLTRLGH